MRMVQLSKRLKISQPTASQSATRGEKITKENKLKLLHNKGRWGRFLVKLNSPFLPYRRQKAL